MANEAEVMQRLRRLVAVQLQLPEADISEDSGIGQPPKWDSMAHVSVILAIEQEFGVQVDEALMNCRTIRELASHLA